MTRRILQIEIPVDNVEEIDPRLAEKIAYVMTNWNDGRYPFETEMLVHGLESIIHNALRKLVEIDKLNEFGREMVQFENGSMAKWWLESQKVVIPHPQIFVDNVVVSLKPDTNNSHETDNP